MKILLRHLLTISLLATTIWSQGPDSNSFSFAWLTDIHVGSTTGEPDLRTVVEDIQQAGNASFAIVSGDISEVDMDNNLDRAKSLLDSMDIPYYIIPGNHDTKWTNSGGARFSQLWDDDRFTFEIGDYRFIGLHQGPLMRMGNGYIDPDDITWVHNVLSSLSDPRQKIFIVMHYPLNPAIDNWHVLRDLIRPYNIQAVLHGHGHANKVQSFEGIPGIMSRSTLSLKKPGAGYTVVQVNNTQADFYERIPNLDSLGFWYSLPLGDHHGADSLLLPYPDYSENDTSGLILAWQKSVGSIITSAPVHDKHTAYITTTGGQVMALDLETGKQKWSWQAAGAIHSTPAVKGSRLVFGSVDSSIVCLSTKDGDLKWQVKTSGSVLGSPRIQGNRVYLGSGDGVFYCLNLRNGKVKWEYTAI